jgi:hypothetical protein
LLKVLSPEYYSWEALSNIQTADQQHLKFQTDLESLPEQMTPLDQCYMCMGTSIWRHFSLQVLSWASTFISDKKPWSVSVFHYADHLWTNPQLLEELITCSSTNHGCGGADGRGCFLHDWISAQTEGLWQFGGFALGIEELVMIPKESKTQKLSALWFSSTAIWVGAFVRLLITKGAIEERLYSRTVLFPSI